MCEQLDEHEVLGEQPVQEGRGLPQGVGLVRAPHGKALELRHELTIGIRAAGYRFVALDLSGYQSGSMNATTVGEATS